MSQMKLVSDEQWVNANFYGASLGDKRLEQRLLVIAGAIVARPHGCLHAAMPDWAAVMAAYRFVHCEAVTLDSVSQPHRDLTRQACAQPGEYLLLEDTTTLDYGSHLATEGLGRTGEDSGKGLFLHSTLACRIERFNAAEEPETTALGVFALYCWARTMPTKLGRETRADRRNRERESQRWGAGISEHGGPPPGAKWTAVSDRESDIFEAFENYALHGIDWIVRACQDRALAETHGRVSGAIMEAPLLGTYDLYIRSRTAQFKKPAQKARTAHVEVRARRVTLQGPYRPGGRLEDRSMYVVEAREVNAPTDVTQPIHWTLFTSWECVTFHEALRAIKAYACRWQIEEYHKALKSGVGVEESQLANASSLMALIGVLAIVALRLMNMKLLASTQPNVPVTEAELGSPALSILTKKFGQPTGGWTQLTALVAIAKLGGFLGRKHDGLPGWITIWRGWHRLASMIEGYLLAAEGG